MQWHLTVSGCARFPFRKGGGLVDAPGGMAEALAVDSRGRAALTGEVSDGSNGPVHNLVATLAPPRKPWRRGALHGPPRQLWSCGAPGRPRGEQ
jgi:hypothetical protein